MSAESNQNEAPFLFCGHHVIGELYGIDAEILNNWELLLQIMEEGIQKSGATLCSVQHKNFAPQGVTILCLLGESHASIHTYPEHRALFFDAFTCGRDCVPAEIAGVLQARLNPSKSHVVTIPRGEW